MVSDHQRVQFDFGWLLDQMMYLDYIQHDRQNIIKSYDASNYILQILLHSERAAQTIDKTNANMMLHKGFNKIASMSKRNLQNHSADILFSFYQNVVLVFHKVQLKIYCHQFIEA